ncbi:ABC transporter permease [Apilactobacillus xinyiensis]|uniref:ABC transporter permease n=1 Tax=Apilactobacillus xinyiensis TaxID=2841032 RepID=UPI001C7DA033|nr:ABC transporter permease [Apilactobacillus xinyiensis]
MFTLLRQELYKQIHGKFYIGWGMIMFLFAMLIGWASNKYNIMSGDVYMTRLSNSIQIILIAMVVFVSTIISNEFASGTIKNLLSRQYSRLQVFLSKLITILFMYVYLIVITFISTYIGRMIFFKSGHIIWKQLGTNLGSYSLFLLLIASAALLISNVAKSGGAAIGIGVAFIFASQIISQLLSILVSHYHWLKWNPFNFMNVNFQLTMPNIDKITLLSNNQMILGTVAYSVLFIFIAGFIFKKRNV